MAAQWIPSLRTSKVYIFCDKSQRQNAILGSLHLLNLFSESPLSFQFQYLRYCSIIEHCTVNKVCIEFHKKSRTEHWECWGNYGSIEVYDCSTQLCGYFVCEADRTYRADNEPLRSFNSLLKSLLVLLHWKIYNNTEYASHTIVREEYQHFCQIHGKPLHRLVRWFYADMA